MNLQDIMRGPHIREWQDIGERTPLVLIEPLRFLPVHADPSGAFVGRALPTHNQHRPRTNNDEQGGAGSGHGQRECHNGGAE